MILILNLNIVTYKVFLNFYYAKFNNLDSILLIVSSLLTLLMIIFIIVYLFLFLK